MRLVKGLDELMEEIRNSPQPYRPSAFWEELAAVGIKQLESGGFENFKRTINMTYFNWSPLGILRHQLLPVAEKWVRHFRWQVFQARFSSYRSERSQKSYHTASNFRTRVPDIASFNPCSAWLYRTYVAMLWECVSENDPLGLLSRLDEPVIGNPFLIHYRGRDTSQDLCNSVHEFYSAGGAQAKNSPLLHIAELGGGYGRLAYVWLKALPETTYCMIDIAPALNVAQEYLSRVFPDEKLFYFRPFRRYEDICDEFESSRIRFLAAHQIELLPPKHFDVFLNISSLHEMTYQQIEMYLRQIDRLCRGRFYTKQWRRSQASVNGFVIRESEYPTPVNWREIYRERHPIQRMFFHALYDVGASDG